MFKDMGMTVPKDIYRNKMEYIYKGSKNIKMLKDVGMTVPKRRETSAVYVQQDRG